VKVTVIFSSAHDLQHLAAHSKMEHMQYQNQKKKTQFSEMADKQSLSSQRRHDLYGHTKLLFLVISNFLIF
jgi:hypothetical protein